MRQVVLAIAFVALGLSGGAGLAQAANADHPYSNVNPANDKGNDTGDSRVPDLNAGQLNQNYKGPLELRAPSTQGQVAGTVQTVPPATRP